jgi:hypothetical protein
MQPNYALHPGMPCMKACLVVASLPSPKGRRRVQVSEEHSYGAAVQGRRLQVLRNGRSTLPAPCSCVGRCFLCGLPFVFALEIRTHKGTFQALLDSHLICLREGCLLQRYLRSHFQPVQTAPAPLLRPTSAMCLDPSVRECLHQHAHMTIPCVVMTIPCQGIRILTIPSV